MQEPFFEESLSTDFVSFEWAQSKTRMLPKKIHASLRCLTSSTFGWGCINEFH